MSDIITCIAKGNSMYPTINHGDTLTVEKGIDNLEVNHIVLCKDTNKKYFVHRIVDFFYCAGIPFIITKGDNCIYEDKPSEIFNVIGIVREIIKLK